MRDGKSSVYFNFNFLLEMAGVFTKLFQHRPFLHPVCVQCAFPKTNLIGLHFVVKLQIIVLEYANPYYLRLLQFVDWKLVRFLVPVYLDWAKMGSHTLPAFSAGKTENMLQYNSIAWLPTR
jgi:hypothetical protein